MCAARDVKWAPAQQPGTRIRTREVVPLLMPAWTKGFYTFSLARSALGNYERCASITHIKDHSLLHTHPTRTRSCTDLLSHLATTCSLRVIELRERAQMDAHYSSDQRNRATTPRKRQRHTLDTPLGPSSHSGRPNIRNNFLDVLEYGRAQRTERSYS